MVQVLSENGGPLERLTISSDADSSTPDIYAEQVRGLVTTHGHSLDLVLPLVTTNPARLLKLQGKGRIAAGCDADLLIVEPEGLTIRDVLARGRCVVRDGQLVHREKFLEKSKRAFELVGNSTPASAVAGLLLRQ